MTPNTIARGTKTTSKTPSDAIEPRRAAQAHRLRLAGRQWAEIATRVGYADGRVAQLAVTADLERAALEQGPEDRAPSLAMELARLDALQVAYWEPALDGDRTAALLVLRIIAERASILGLDKPDKSAPYKPVSIVITGTSEEYIGGLQAIADSPD